MAKQAARRSAVGRLVDKLFHGSSEQLLVHLVRERKLSADDLTRIRRAIRAEAERGKRRAEEGRRKSRGAGE